MKSSAQLIKDHSHARILLPSSKPLILGWGVDPLSGRQVPKLGRPLAVSDIHRQMEKLK